MSAFQVCWWVVGLKAPVDHTTGKSFAPHSAESTTLDLSASTANCKFTSQPIICQLGLTWLHVFGPSVFVLARNVRLTTDKILLSVALAENSLN